MLKLNESQAKEFIAELAAQCAKRWKETVDKTRFMDELREGKLKKETIGRNHRTAWLFSQILRGDTGGLERVIHGRLLQSHALGERASPFRHPTSQFPDFKSEPRV